ncbi:MAG: putative rane protein [Planctomycetota bacterium]|nr:putative rane protein [Planctomycetota bacterium]
MPRVSLILPSVPGDPRPDGEVAAYRSALEAAGHEVEVLIVVGPGVPPGLDGGDGWRRVVANDPGLASAAMAGLDAADGSVLLVLDPRMGYQPEDLARVVAPLAEGRAELAIGSRWCSPSKAGWLFRLLGQFAKPFTSTTDPLSGLVGVTREAIDASSHRFGAVGAKFSLELLGKLKGRREDVAVETRLSSRGRLPGWDDVRHMKRLADHRYGNGSRLIQFCVVGASGMCVDLFSYFVFQKLYERTSLAYYNVPPTKVSLALAMAGSSAIAVALVWNFSLNRRLTFSYARGGSLPRQFAAYVASNLLGVMVSLAFRLLLPRKVAFFNAHKLAAAVVGIIAATGISFSMSRWVVFRNNPSVASVENDEPVDDRSPSGSEDGRPLGCAIVIE